MDGPIHSTLAHAPQPLMERAVDLDLLDSRTPHLSRRAAAGGRLGGDRDPRALARAVQGAATPGLKHTRSSAVGAGSVRTLVESSAAGFASHSVRSCRPPSGGS